MIPLLVPARSDAPERFVTRLAATRGENQMDSLLLETSGEDHLFTGPHGLFLIATDQPILGDVVCIDPHRNSAERLIRAQSSNNTLLVTEQCDQLCVMCSQPPKKRHDDRFHEYRQAIEFAPEGAVIGLSGGEPTLHKHALFALLCEARERRPDIFFHILSNGQHFDADDIPALRDCAENTLWGIPLYSHDGAAHDRLVAKIGAFERLLTSFEHCLQAGVHIELRTVIMQPNFHHLPDLARMVANHLGFISQWSIMQLENIGFARNRFYSLYVDHSAEFEPLAEAIDVATLFAVPVALFNMPRCSIPVAFRSFAANSISDWKQKYAPACGNCAEAGLCAGFFEWHPDAAMRVHPI